MQDMCRNQTIRYKYLINTKTFDMKIFCRLEKKTFDTTIFRPLEKTFDTTIFQQLEKKLLTRQTFDD